MLFCARPSSLTLVPPFSHFRRPPHPPPTHHPCHLTPPALPSPQSMGYQMSTRPRARPAKPSATPPRAAPALQQGQPEVAAAAELAPAAPIPLASLSVSAQPDEPFRDVVEPIVVENDSRELLSGTELEAAPEKRGRPVPVVKPGQAVPLQLQPGSGTPQAAAVAAPQVCGLWWGEAKPGRSVLRTKVPNRHGLNASCFSCHVFGILLPLCMPNFDPISLVAVPHRCRRPRAPCRWSSPKSGPPSGTCYVPPLAAVRKIPMQSRMPWSTAQAGAAE